MRVFAYAVFDTASGVYDRPFFMHSDGVAMRSFGDAVVGNDSVVGKHPEDFTLFRIGEFDDNKGILKGESPVCLCTALEMVAESRKIAPGSLKSVEIK